MVTLTPENGDVRKVDWSENLEYYSNGLWIPFAFNAIDNTRNIEHLRTRLDVLEKKTFRNEELEQKHPELKNIADLYEYMEEKLKTFEALKDDGNEK